MVMATLLVDKYEARKEEVNARFEQLRANEEELNRIFAEIYNMVGEVPIEVEDKYVSVAKIFDTEEEIPESYKGNKYVRTKRDEITSLISYAVGCMFGRYSLDVDGLVLADQGDTLENYLAKMPDPNSVTFMPDDDNVIPITDEEYFGDDIVGRFVAFAEAVYGAETLEQNLQFIAEALGGKGSPRQVIRQYFLKEFFKDHCKTYKKRPIYWLFDSGKKAGFRALIYMHRYQPDLLARVRTEYVHQQQDRYRTQIEFAENELATAEKGARVKLDKRIKKLSDQLTEATAFEEKLHHLADQMIEIDLDDGVKVNYAKFQDVLAKIK
jgi:type II restriction/modification system DNA methylase subunit YeeA